MINSLQAQPGAVTKVKWPDEANEEEKKLAKTYSDKEFNSEEQTPIASVNTHKTIF